MKNPSQLYIIFRKIQCEQNFTCFYFWEYMYFYFEKNGLHHIIHFNLGTKLVGTTYPNGHMWDGECLDYNFEEYVVLNTI